MEIMSYRDVAPACATRAASKLEDKYVSAHLPAGTSVKGVLPDSLREGSLPMQSAVPKLPMAPARPLAPKGTSVFFLMDYLLLAFINLEGIKE